MSTRDQLQYVADNASTVIPLLHVKEADDLIQLERDLKQELSRPCGSETGYRREVVLTRTIKTLSRLRRTTIQRRRSLGGADTSAEYALAVLLDKMWS